MDEADISRLMQDSGVIRHRGKLEAIVQNARALLAMEAAGDDFSRFIWSFVNDRPILHYYADYRQAPVTSEPAMALSKALKQRGFKFIGPTICHAFMQACGLINDHQTTCFRHPDNL